MPNMRVFKAIANNGLWGLFSLLFTGAIVASALFTYMELGLPNVDTLKDVHLQVPLEIYTRDGLLMAQYGSKRRIPATIQTIPKPLINAVLATEDARFYSHPGVDFIGIVRAAKAVILSGKKVQGASTITMQVARNFFLSRKKSYLRKIKEILLALKIERNFSKNKILELYLNKVYFGKRAYGVAAAAQVYYGKSLSDLTLPEMAMIAGLPQAPSRDNPINNPVAAKERRDHVLSRMAEVGFIDQATYQHAISAPLTATYHGEKIAVNAPYAAEAVRKKMYTQYGDAIYDQGFDVYTTIDSAKQIAANQALASGLLAYDARHGYRHPTHSLGDPTSADPAQWASSLKALLVIDNMYPAAVMALAPNSLQALMPDGNEVTINWAGLSWARPLKANGRYRGRQPKSAADIVSLGDVIRIIQDPSTQQWRLTQLPDVQGALVSIDPQSGAILALDGGFNYRLSNFNRATQARRQPGSNFKPFIYSAALAKGFTLASLINDAPVVLKDSGENQLWRPENDTGQFYGPTRLRIGLVKSRNLVSIRLLAATGIDYALNYIQHFGFNPANMPHTLSLALGSASTSPLQIAGAYTVFANGGYRVLPHLINQVVDQTGHIVYQANPAKACPLCLTHPHIGPDFKPNPIAPVVITPQNAYLITDALQGVIQNGTGRAARVLKRPDLAGKTGTTNRQVDAWFSGYNTQIETTVWVGFDDSARSLYEYGSKAALPIWIDYMRAALKKSALAAPPEPPGIVTVRIDPKTGQRAYPNEPGSFFEAFRQDNVPTVMASQGNASPVATTPSPTGNQPLF